MNTLLSLIQASLFLDDYFEQLQKYKIIMKTISIKQYIDLAKPKSGSQGPGYSKTRRLRGPRQSLFDLILRSKIMQWS